MSAGWRVGEHGNVLGLGLGQLCRGQAHHAGEDEEHHETEQDGRGALEDGVRLLDRLLAVIATLGQEKLEMAGLWLKENTSTGMVSHRVMAKSLPDGTWERAAPVQSGIR